MGTPDSDRSAAELVGMAVRRVRQSAISFDWSARADPGARPMVPPGLAALPLARQEVVRRPARDGLELEGILVRPLHERPGERHPLIVAMHGGPEAHVGNGWITSYSTPGQVAAGLISRLRGGAPDAVHRGTESCCIEFGAGRIRRVDIDFFSNPAGPIGVCHEPSLALRRDKESFGSGRRARWFGL